MALQAIRRANVRLPPEVNRILYVRNLPYKISSEEMYDIFGKYGPIRQIRVGDRADTKVSLDLLYLVLYFIKTTTVTVTVFLALLKGRESYTKILYFHLKTNDASPRFFEVERVNIYCFFFHVFLLALVVLSRAIFAFACLKLTKNRLFQPIFAIGPQNQLFRAELESN